MIDIQTFSERCAALGIRARAPRTRRYLQSITRGLDLQGARVLDIGGGTGLLTLYAACVGGASEVVCLEPGGDGSESNVLERFNQAASALGVVDRVRLDARTLQSFDAGSPFDVVMSHNSINHFDEAACERLPHDADAEATYLALCGKVSRLCRAGGQLMVADCAARNLFGDLGLTNPLVRSIEWNKHQAPEVWARMLEQTGFRRTSLRWTPIHAMWSPLAAMTANRPVAWTLMSHFAMCFERLSSVHQDAEHEAHSASY